MDDVEKVQLLFDRGAESDTERVAVSRWDAKRDVSMASFRWGCVESYPLVMTNIAMVFRWP